MPKKPGTFGPMVLGEEKFAAEKRVVAKRAHKFGPLVVGPDEEEPAAAASTVTVASVAELETKLRAAGLDPEKLAQALAAVKPAAAKLAEAVIEHATIEEEPTPAREYTPPAEAPDAAPGTGPAQETAPEVRQETPAAAPAAAKPAETLDTDGNGYTTIAELLRALNANAVSVEQALALELASEKPRKGAFQAILAKELQRAGGARPEVQAAIEAEIGKLG